MHHSPRGGGGGGVADDDDDDKADGGAVINDITSNIRDGFDVDVDVDAPADDMGIGRRKANTPASRENHASSSSSSSSSSATRALSIATRGGGGATSSSSHISSKFPVSKTELPHFAYMSFMMFLFIYVFTTVRDTKDTLVVSNCGAESIPFLKLYAVMPCATAFIVLYSKLSDILDKKMLFYVTLVPFFVFYGLFAFVLFPNRDGIHFLPSSSLGVGGATSAAMNLLRYWSYSLYFVVSELWASAGVPLLFWQVSEEEEE